MSIHLLGIRKSFGGVPVLRGVSCTLEDGGRYCLMGPSGAGKTTLLRIMLGLERADSGTVVGLATGEASVMFQEDRLCNALTPLENVALVLPGISSSRDLRAVLTEILPESCLDKPVLQLSGGQRRRVSLARAMAYPSRAVIMDEPFTGLDAETRRTAIAFVKRHLRGRVLLASTHGEDDARMLGAHTLHLAELFEDERRSPSGASLGERNETWPKSI